jgi:hypothetical protein
VKLAKITILLAGLLLAAGFVRAARAQTWSNIKADAKPVVITLVRWPYT